MNGETVLIPLLEVSSEVSRRQEEVPSGLTRKGEVEVPVSPPIAEGCFALRISDSAMEPVIEPCSLAVFGPAGSQKALHGVYLLGVEGDRPMVRKVVKKDADSPGEKDRSSPASLSARVNARRKSFMTPTPLHMPDSRVSPIPDSSHEMIYLKCFREEERVMVVPARKLVWSYPLILLVTGSQSSTNSIKSR